MLVLSRRVNGSIKIGDDITVTVLRISGPNVRIGIEAPGHIPVHRDEVAERIALENSPVTPTLSSVIGFIVTFLAYCAQTIA